MPVHVCVCVCVRRPSNGNGERLAHKPQARKVFVQLVTGKIACALICPAATAVHLLQVGRCRQRPHCLMVSRRTGEKGGGSERGQPAAYLSCARLLRARSNKTHTHTHTHTPSWAGCLAKRPNRSPSSRDATAAAAD